MISLLFCKSTLKVPRSLLLMPNMHPSNLSLSTRSNSPTVCTYIAASTREKSEHFTLEQCDLLQPASTVHSAYNIMVQSDYKSARLMCCICWPKDCWTDQKSDRRQER